MKRAIVILSLLVFSCSTSTIAYGGNRFVAVGGKMAYADW